MAEPIPESTETGSVFRALADPTRRAILDWLRQGPMTTGELAKRFGETRFTMMRHLAVLRGAGMVLVRREGRERWNVLNPVPMQEVYRRWIRPFERGPADRLLRLKHHAELEREGEMLEVGKFRTLDINLEIEVKASPSAVWRALTRDIGEWWPARFYVGSSPRRFVVEPRVGGMVFEDWGDGEGSLFGTVTALEKDRVLQWAGDMSAEFGGPARTVTTFRLTKWRAAGSTLVAFRDTPFGLLSEQAMSGLEPGWRWLISSCLQPYLEEGKRPERPESVVSR